MRELARRRQVLEPAGDVLAVEAIEPDGPEPGVDVGGRPLVLLAGLDRDVRA